MEGLMMATTWKKPKSPMDVEEFALQMVLAAARTDTTGQGFNVFELSAFAYCSPFTEIRPPKHLGWILGEDE